MTAEHAIALVKAVADLLGVLVWPAVAVFVLVRFGPGLREFFGSLGKLSFKAAGIEATAERQQTAAVAAALGAAIATSSDAASATPAQAARRAQDVADVVAERVTPRALRQATGSRVLWVDDHPENNVFERRSLEALGIDFDLSTSSVDALSRLTATPYDAVISDMRRADDTRAAYTLLDAMHERGLRTPFIIYAGANAPEPSNETQRKGVLGRTNRPDELFSLVLTALGVNSRR